MMTWCDVCVCVSLSLSFSLSLSLQAVNKLAEILNRKDMKLDHKKKGSTADLRKKEKENRKLQLDLNQEKEKFNHMANKCQKELSEMQAVSGEATTQCCHCNHHNVMATTVQS